MGKMTVRYALSRETAGGGGKKHNKGFTLLETLLVVAILVILLCLAMVGVARWRDYLKITELDNAARAIYMAAENRVVLLRNNGTAASLLNNKSLSEETVTSADGDSSKTTVLCVLPSKAAEEDVKAVLNELLPEGVIDPALRDGNFYILYDKNTYHVFEVFYAEKGFDQTKLSELRDRDRSGRVGYYREKSVASLVGHYAGGLAGGPDPNQLPTPGVDVLITNGEELTLTVRYTMPEGLPIDVTVNREPSVKLNYGGEVVDLLAAGLASRLKCDENKSINDIDISDTNKNRTATYTWVLDSLDYKTKDASGNSITVSQPFKGLFDSTNMPDALGGDFTVTASLKLSAAGYTESSYYAKGTDNSLFGTDTHDGETAYIVNLRHLQNLDNPTSGAARKRTAVQLENIDASTVKNNANEVIDNNYEFRPIQNWDLKGFNAGSTSDAAVPYSISNLKVTQASANGKNGAGLFGGVAEGFMFQNIRLVKPNIVAQTRAAGALAGNTVGFKLTNCWVEEGSIECKASWAGGLVGYWWGTLEFDNCRIKNLTVKSSSAAGGLAGDGAAAVFNECVVENVIVANTWGNAGGLVGTESAGATIENCKVTDTKIYGTSVGGGLVGSIGSLNASTKVEIKSCTIQNIIVTGIDYAGGLVGVSATADEYSNCEVVDAQVGYDEDSTYSTHTAGGLVGKMTGATIENCNASSSVVRSRANAGGLVGDTTGGEMSICAAVDVEVGEASNCTKWPAEAGGLVGKTKGTNFKNCKVYLSDSGSKVFKVFGKTAGGLVGAIRNGGSITESFAATNVNGTVYAGGLVGNLGNPENSYSGDLKVSITRSYACCYLRVEWQAPESSLPPGEKPSPPSAGGLIGMKAKNIKLELTNVYAAGYITMIGNEYRAAAGLCGGEYETEDEGITAKNAYAVMEYINVPKIQPLADFTSGNASNCCTGNNIGSFNRGNDFEINVESHPYNLYGGGRVTYPYPGLKGLPHYGDWP